METENWYRNRIVNFTDFWEFDVLAGGGWILGLPLNMEEGWGRGTVSLHGKQSRYDLIKSTLFTTHIHLREMEW